MAKTGATAIGLRVKSGWALAVLVSGTVDAPRALDRRVVELSDANLPESRQPYHAATGKEETDAERIKQRIKIVERVASCSVNELVDRHRSLAGRLRGAGLIVGSLIEPEKIANPHIRAHAYEGKLFRTVLQEALGRYGVRCQVVTEREAYGVATAALDQSEGALRRVLDGMRSDLGRPWGANEKLAALAGWIALR